MTQIDVVIRDDSFHLMEFSQMGGVCCLVSIVTEKQAYKSAKRRKDQQRIPYPTQREATQTTEIKLT